jgi:hypothetical protein
MNSWPTRWASLIDAKAAWALGFGAGTAVELACVGGGELDVAAVVAPLVTLASGVDPVAGTGVWLTGGRPAEVDVQAAGAASTSTALHAARRRLAGVIR